MDVVPGTSIDAPSCPKCGYLLLGLTTHRCPECGNDFDPEILRTSFRAALLPWERPESGGRIARLFRTLIQAWLRPARYFSSVSHRKDRPIRQPYRLVGACLITALLFHVFASVLDRALFWLRMTIKHGDPLVAFNTVIKTFGMTWSTGLMLWFMQILGAFCSIVGLGVLIGRKYRERLASLRMIDMTGSFSPAIPLARISHRLN